MSVSPLPTAQALWHDVLAELEQELDHAELLLAGGADAEAGESAEPRSWTAPTPAVPIPADLVPRAERLLQRHQQVTAQVADRLGAHRSQLRLTDRFAHATARVSVAAYVDTTA